LKEKRSFSPMTAPKVIKDRGSRRQTSAMLMAVVVCASPVHPRAANQHAKKAQNDIFWPSLERALSFSPEFIARNDGQNQARQNQRPKARTWGLTMPGAILATA
jgi:hypothetical protein